jgi:hypothetical protein
VCHVHPSFHPAWVSHDDDDDDDDDNDDDDDDDDDDNDDNEGGWGGAITAILVGWEPSLGWRR